MDDLIEFLRIPSISALPEHAADVHRAAVWVRDWLEKAGLDGARLIEDDAGGNPLIFAESLKAPGKPALLLYGHYDVQPPDPLDEWTSPPFEPQIRNENIYARGSADDKGQLYILMQAAARAIREGVPVNLKFLIEGEEETNGEHLDKYVRARPPHLKSDAAVICDTSMFAPDLPTLTTGLRGIVYGEIHVQGPRTDLHSGDYGGAAPNAIEAAAQIIATLKDRDGHILIPGLYDRVQKPAAAEIAAWNSLPFDPEEYREKEIGSTALTGEPEIPLFERLWSRPTFEVHGIRGGFTAEGSKTVIPARAVIKISLRLVPDQRPEEIVKLVKKAVGAAAPRGVTASFKLLSSAAASVVDPDHPLIRKCADAMKKVFGHETVYVRCGGSIPIVGLFKDALGIPSVLAGFGLPDDNIHAPNEKMSIANIERGIESMVEYFKLVAQ